jgi:hypothetical protein
LAAPASRAHALALLAVLARFSSRWLIDDVVVRVHAARRVPVHRIALVPGWIHAAQGVVEHVAVRVEALAAERVLNEWIHAEKTAQRRVVGAAVHVDEAVRVEMFVGREAAGGRGVLAAVQQVAAIPESNAYRPKSSMQKLPQPW